MLGESYRLNMNDKALEWYKNAYDQQYGSDALKEYVYTLKRTEQYTLAAQQFKDLGIEIGSPTNPGNNGLPASRNLEKRRCL